MSAGFDVNISGFADLKRKLQAVKANLKRNAQNEIMYAGVQMQTDAKRSVATGGLGRPTGRLISGIQIYPRADRMGVTVTSEASYSPYHEFGTGNLVSVPAGYEEVAMKFKGAGIRQVNIQPRPFMLPNYFKNRDELLKSLREMNLL